MAIGLEDGITTLDQYMLPRKQRNDSYPMTENLLVTMITKYIQKFYDQISEL